MFKGSSVMAAKILFTIFRRLHQLMMIVMLVIVKVLVQLPPVVIGNILKLLDNYCLYISEYLVMENAHVTMNTQETSVTNVPQVINVVTQSFLLVQVIAQLLVILLPLAPLYLVAEKIFHESVIF